MPPIPPPLSVAPPRVCRTHMAWGSGGWTYTCSAAGRNWPCCCVWNTWAAPLWQSVLGRTHGSWCHSAKETRTKVKSEERPWPWEGPRRRWFPWVLQQGKSCPLNCHLEAEKSDNSLQWWMCSFPFWYSQFWSFSTKLCYCLVQSLGCEKETTDFTHKELVACDCPPLRGPHRKILVSEEGPGKWELPL